MALLVLPCPQNMLIQKGALDRLPANALPVDSLLLVARLLGNVYIIFLVEESFLYVFFWQSAVLLLLSFSVCRCCCYIFL